MGLNCFNFLFGRTSRELTKLKNLLNLTLSRLPLLRGKRQTRGAQAQADVAQFLLLGHIDRALLRAELVIRERNMLDVISMVESYCHLLIERAFLLHNQRECPEELREAAAGLSFAASRCSELPELREVRRIFSSRFGKEFVTAAVELRNNCGVSGKMVQKFSTRQPSLELRVKVTKEIAIEKGIKVELAEPSPNTEEVINPNIERKRQQTKPTLEQLSTSSDLNELLGSQKLVKLAKEKYKDAGTAALAAFESAAYAAAAAKTAIELFRSESEGKSSNKMKLSKHMDINFPSTSCCCSVDIGCRASKVRSVRIESVKQTGKEILNEIDESDDDEELIRLASKPMVPMSRARSFAGMIGNELKILGSNKDDDCEVSEMAIVSVDSERKSKSGRYADERRDEFGLNSFSVRTRNW